MYKSNIRNKKKSRGKKREKVEILYPEDGQEFGYVKDMLGNGRVKIMCEDGITRIGRIRGSMRQYKNKVIIKAMDLILISKRDYEDDKVDIIHKYSPEDSSLLYTENELPDKIAKIYQNRDEYNILETFENITEDNNFVLFLNNNNDDDDDNHTNINFLKENQDIEQEDDSSSIDIDDI